MIAAFALGWIPGTARADWNERPGFAQLASYLARVDSVVVSSIELPSAAAARGKHGVEVLEVAGLRGSVSRSRTWGRQFVEALLSGAPADRKCNCALWRKRDDTTAIVPVAQLHVRGQVVEVPIVFREDCASVFLPQGVWGGLPIGRNRDGLWQLLRAALESDPAFQADSAPPRIPSPTGFEALPGSPADATPGVVSAVAAWDDDRGYVRLDELPEALKRVPPTYPEVARARGIRGTVLVRALVGTNGAVQEAWAEWKLPHLEEAALRVVPQWRFKPARSAGKPIAVWVTVPVKFSLR